MKIVLSMLMLSCVMSITPVYAGMFDGLAFSVQDKGYGGARGNQDRRQFRDARPARAAPAERNERGRGQMTQEERQQLHRDLDKANREIYRGHRGRPY